MTAVHRNVAESGGALSARSVVLSLLLGHHPASLPSAYLTRAGEHFGISASTVRVALARAVAAGDLHREGKEYVLGERLLRRQRRQDEAIEPVQARWDGQWEMAVVVVSGRTSGDRASLRETLSEDRLAELREGVWMRPANLQRVPAHQSHPVLSTFRATPDEDPAALAARLWDLSAWSRRAQTLMDAMGTITAPPARLATAAEMVRHLATDPILPAALVPADWPGEQLRAVYAAYQLELRALGSSDGE